MFEHEWISLEELRSETTENGRFYTTPTGSKYPSVTTILSHGTDQSWKEEWVARVGKEEADRISRKATTRGTAVHELTEQYLRNNPSYSKGHMPSNIMSFKKIQPFLDAHIGKIAGLEIPLYSNKLRTAGRVDCVAEWDKSWAIVDFKTSKKEKTRDDIHSYFLQCSAYAMMMFERTGVLCKNAVIVMTVDDGKSQVFIEKTRDWLPKFIEIREKVAL
jgi:ATP-dependent exoDNAse (exonuclease V) beta subunit